MTETIHPQPAQDPAAQGPPRLATNRWTRSGQDRLYVNGPEGETLGYRDLKTGADHAETLLHRAVVGTVADTWIHTTGWVSPARVRPVAEPQSATGAAAPQTAISATTMTMTQSAWTDLSRNRPGTAVRAVAESTALSGADADSWRLGAEGEEHVGAVLDEVTRAWPAWQAFHSVPVGHRGSDIDHVVIGPGGVFTLNTKHHQDASIYVRRDGFFINGSRSRHVRNARHEAARAARLLSAAVGVRLHVTGLIVPVGARTITVKEAPDDVFVVPAHDLHRWLRSTGTILPLEVLARVWEAARRSTTWEC